MVNRLPRNVDEDYCVNVHIKRRKIHRTSYLMGLVTKRTIEAWLQYLVATPLYRMYDVTIDDSFFNLNQSTSQVPQDEISENITIEESLTAQQQTLWNEEKYLRIAPGEANVPRSLLFDEHAEELSFPAIYLGHFRNFREGVRVTPFMIATSELRRVDRSGVTTQHLLYMTMEIMRLRE
ncbi:ATP-dependent DNA helicase [Trichonephila clavipes]|nr:ATP-dependent DNA helicase [Trichonephila clavipes]